MTRKAIQKRIQSIRVPDDLNTGVDLSNNKSFNSPYGYVGSIQGTQLNDPHIYKILGGTQGSYLGGNIEVVEYQNSDLTEVPADLANADLTQGINLAGNEGWGYAINVYSGLFVLLANFRNLSFSGGSDIPINGLCYAPAIVELPVAGSGTNTGTYEFRVPLGVY